MTKLVNTAIMAPHPAPAAAEPDVGAPASTACPPQQVRWHHGAFRYVLRGVLHLYEFLMAVARRIGPRPRTLNNGRGDVLLTGSFYSENWITAHLRPIAASRSCRRVWIVSTFPIPPTPKVVAIYPPDWLRRMLGDVPARLLTFIWTGLRRRPHVVGGFHLLVNGLLASLLARTVGARSLYFCVGGPMEMLDGGIWAENRVFGRLKQPDAAIEQQLVRTVGNFDAVVTMGTGAVRFFHQRGVPGRYHVVSGGIDTTRFHPGGTDPTYDLILVGRLAPVKRIDLFLRTVQRVANAYPGVRAAIVGDGEERAALENLAQRLDITGNVAFLGHQRDTGTWLRRARVFMLTSRSEGLALSLMEAMACGLPAIVTDVGDLADLVDHGANGYLIREHSPEALADPIVELLTDESKRAAFAQAALRSAARYAPAAVAGRWDTILHDVVTQTEPETHYDL